MRKARWSLVMITCAAVTLMIACVPGEAAVEAPIVQVQRGDVHQVIAISGKITYAEAAVACSPSNGVVARLCVQVGDRVGENEALLRLDTYEAEQHVSAFANQVSQLAGDEHVELMQQVSLNNMVIRAKEACTIRELYVQEDDMVTVGMPVARVSSNQQEIVCRVCEADLDEMKPGMWAWLSVSGESLGFAEVVKVGELEADILSGLTSAEVILTPAQHIDLPEGANVDADIFLRGSDDVLTLPLEAITDRGTAWWVSEGRCTEIPVQIVMTDEMLAWVVLPEGISIAIGEFEEGQMISEAGA